MDHKPVLAGPFCSIHCLVGATNISVEIPGIGASQHYADTAPEVASDFRNRLDDPLGDLRCRLFDGLGRARQADDELVAAYPSHDIGVAQ